MHGSEFHSARSHVNADNEVTSHRSEILVKSQTGLTSLRVSCKRALLLKVFLWECVIKFDNVSRNKLGEAELRVTVQFVPVH